MHEEHHNDDNGHRESDHGNIQIKSPSSDGANEEDTIYNNQTHCQDRSYNFHRTLYGPGELEMFRHQQLQQSVRDAKLKVYYPGRWGRHSPRARFRIPLFHNDGQANCNHGILNVGEVNTANKKVGSRASLLKFRSNARIISALWTVPSCNDLNHSHNMRLDHVDETSNQYAGNPSSIDMDCHAVLQDQKSNEEGSLLKKQNRVLQSNQQPPLQQDKNKERTIKLNWESTIQTVCNERVYDHILLLPSKCNSLSNASHNYKDAKNNDQYKLHDNCINCYTDFEGNNCQDGESSVLILELDSRLPNVSAVPIINESNTEVENTRGDKKIVECEKLSEMDKGQHHQTLQNNGAQEEDAISKIQEEGAFDVNDATSKLLDPPPCVTLQCSSSGCNIHGNGNSGNINHNNHPRNNRHEQHQHNSRQLNLSCADDYFQWECQSYWNNDTAWKWMKVGDNCQKSESNVSDDHGVEDNWIHISSCWNYRLPFYDDSFGHKEEQSKEEIVHRRAQIPMRDADTYWRFPHQMELCDISTVEPVRQIPLCTKSDSQKCTVVHNDCMDDNAVDCNDKDNSSRHYNHTLVYDFGKELLGKVVISIPSSLASLAKIKLRVGETLAEAMNEEDEYYEQSLELCHHYPNDCGATCDTASIVDETKATTLRPLDEKDVHHFWISVHLLAFRYVRVVFGNDCMEIVSASLNNSPPAHVAALDPMACSNVKVVCQAHMPRLTRQGSFSCSDLAGISDNENLDNQIWSSAEYTLKLCVHHNFIVDGIKRDRLPWAGDLAVSLMANAYSFHNDECIHWTLTVLGRCGVDRIPQTGSITGNEGGDEKLDCTIRKSVSESHVNGIVDYSFWFVITHWLYQLYFENIIFLQSEWEWIELRLRNLILWGSDQEHGWFLFKEDDWVFIDWTADKEKNAAVQILWWWSLECGISLTEKMMSLAPTDQLKAFLSMVRHSQSLLEQSFLALDDIQLSYSRHAHILGVLSGLYSRLDDLASECDWSNPDTSHKRGLLLQRCRGLYAKSRDALLGNGLAVGTPYMKNLECLALNRIGERSTALVILRKYWAGMIKSGATTFFEAFEEDEMLNDVAKFYDRPFGRSLCHAWGAGPCALLPEILLGLRPLSDGWGKWICDPLDCVTTASAIVETVHGVLEVRLDSVQLRVVVPEGTTMILMNKIYSSGRYSIHRKNLISSYKIQQFSKKYRGWIYHAEHIISPSPDIPGYDGIQMTDVPTIYQLPGQKEKFYMSFIGFDGIGYQTFVAESNDLLEWTKFRLAMGYGEEGMFDHGGVVLGAYLYDSYDVSAPRILKKIDGKFYSLYGAYAKKGTYEPDPGYQGLASSEDGLVWKRELNESILSIYGPGIVKEWEKDSIYQPWLLEHNSIFYNFYNAKQMPQWIEMIGLATSKDLKQWERHDNNPVLRVCARHDKKICDGFDTQFASDAKVFWDNGGTKDDGNAVENDDDDDAHWVMFYFGVGKGGAHIMIAHSKDLVHWVPDPVPLYAAGGNPSGLDKQYAHKISLVRNPCNETFYMFYCAVGDAGRGIGLITSKPV